MIELQLYKIYRYMLMLTILTLPGCTIGYRGPIDYPPNITSNKPAEITVKRIWSLNIGAQPFTFLINDSDVYKLNNGESISFKIDPGEYKFSVNSTGGWKMWNSHHLYLSILPGRSYRIILEADFNWGSSITNATDNGLPLSPETKNTENTATTHKKKPFTTDNGYAHLPKPLNELPPKTNEKNNIPSGGNVKQDGASQKFTKPTRVTEEGYKVWEIVGKGMDINFNQDEAAGRPILGKDIAVGDSFIVQGKEFKLLKNSGWVIYYNEHKSVYEVTPPSMKPLGIRAPKNELVIITVLKQSQK